MALYIELRVNDRTINYIGIQRQNKEVIEGVPSVYKIVPYAKEIIDMEKGQVAWLSHKPIGTVEHLYEDGAEALAIKALSLLTNKE